MGEPSVKILVVYYIFEIGRYCYYYKPFQINKVDNADAVCFNSSKVIENLKV